MNPIQSITASMPSSLMTKPVVAKQLGELLQEQQEPFILEIYLLEKGYLKKSANWGPKNKRSCSKIVKAVFNKLVLSIRNTRKPKNSACGDGSYGVWEIGRRSNQDTVDSDRFSSASGTTVFHSCSGSDTEDRTGSLQPDSVLSFKIGNLVKEKEIDTDRRLPWRCREENNKELSPISVPEEVPSHENSQVLSNKSQRNAKTKDSMLAIPVCKFMFESPIDEPSTDTPSQYLTGKRVSQQSKQLLFDCMRELLEGYGSARGRRKELLEIMEPLEICKILSKDIRTWNEVSGNVTNTRQLLHSDFAASAEEWRGFDVQMREIGAVIGDAIMEDIIEEIVVDMIELLERGRFNEDPNKRILSGCCTVGVVRQNYVVVLDFWAHLQSFQEPCLEEEKTTTKCLNPKLYVPKPEVP